MSGPSRVPGAPEWKPVPAANLRWSPAVISPVSSPWANGVLSAALRDSLASTLQTSPSMIDQIRAKLGPNGSMLGLTDSFPGLKSSWAKGVVEVASEQQRALAKGLATPPWIGDQIRAIAGLQSAPSLFPADVHRLSSAASVGGAIQSLMKLQDGSLKTDLQTAAVGIDYTKFGLGNIGSGLLKVLTSDLNAVSAPMGLSAALRLAARDDRRTSVLAHRIDRGDLSEHLLRDAADEAWTEHGVTPTPQLEELFTVSVDVGLTQAHSETDHPAVAGHAAESLVTSLALVLSLFHQSTIAGAVLHAPDRVLALIAVAVRLAEGPMW